MSQITTLPSSLPVARCALLGEMAQQVTWVPMVACEVLAGAEQQAQAGGFVAGGGFGAVDGDEEIQLALSRLNLSDINMEVAERVGSESVRPSVYL
jgi:hypothetical protein